MGLGLQVVPKWDTCLLFVSVFQTIKIQIFKILRFVIVFLVFQGLYMFVYRYHCLSIACPDIGTAWVHHLSTTCPKIEHLDTASLKRIVGWGIDDIIPMVEFLDASMIGGFGPNLGILHDFITVDKEFRFKVVGVPELEQGHIEADMGWVQPTVLRELFKYPIEMLDVIDFFQT